jgi:prolyl-tRNA editing enzyme YbaK/EbsC (Cys-tRNA(Pro) deacylase)
MSGAIDRFTEAARAAGLTPDVRRFPERTKTAQDAATAIGVQVGQIVKSLIFMGEDPRGDRPVLALTSGANRVDEAVLAGLVGVERLRRATPEEARTATGFAVGGTPPFGHPGPLGAFCDEDLLGYDEIWAAAGTPDAVFALTPAELLRVSGAEVARFRADVP